jgi:hypothetical protein
MRNTHTKSIPASKLPPEAKKAGNSILSDRAFDNAKKATQTREGAIAFLQRAGILDGKGNLAAPYR